MYIKQQQPPRATFLPHIQHVISLVLAVLAWLGSATDLQAANAMCSTHSKCFQTTTSTRSETKEAISQTLRFLDSVGYHEPLECQQKSSPLKTTHLAGILSPKDQASASALAGVLKPTNVPIIAYTTASLQEFIDQGVGNLNPLHPLLTLIFRPYIRCSSDCVSGFQQKDEAGVQINEQLLKSKKVWITLELHNDGNEGGELDENTTDFLETVAKEMNSSPDEIKLQLITIRTKHTPLAEFNAYFLRVLTNNYESFSLLSSYVQQVFNCSIESSKSVENNIVSSAFEQSVYSLALAIKSIEGDAALKELCESPFLKDVPVELKTHSIRYHLHTTQDENQVILLTDIPIEAVLVEREGRDEGMLYKSICQPYKPNCGRCNDDKGELAVKRMDDDSIFLSNPQQYSLYLAGLFDFHEGPNCEILLRESVGLPLAFAYTMWSFKARSSQTNLLNGVDFGAILVDSCSSDRTVMEFLVDSENNCYKFSQADSNWTVVAGSTFGYISTSSVPKTDLSGASPPPPTVIQRFFASKNSPAPQCPVMKGCQGTRQILEANALEYVNVVLDREDADSISQFHQFKLHSKGICIASISQSNSPSSGESEATANVTVLFTTAKVAADYLSGRLRQWNGANGMGDRVHVMVGESHDFYLHDPTNLAHYSGTVSIQPKDVMHADFREWLEGVTPLTLPETWFWRHVEEYWHCALSLRNKDLYQGRMCTGDELLNVPQMGRLTKAGYLSKSVEILLLAADQVHRKLCPYQSGICPEFAEHGRLLIRNLLAETVIEEEFEVLEFQPIDHHGNFGYKLLSNYSARAGFHQLDNYKSYANGVQLSTSQLLTSQCQVCKCIFALPSTSTSQRRFSPSSSDKTEASNREEVFHGSYIKKVPAGSNNVEELLVYDADFEALSGEEWPSRDTFKYVFLCLTTVFTVLALATLILVCVKMYFRIVKGNQSLGILLFEPSDGICRCRIMLHAIAHTLCFGVMIVKAIQLQNSETLGVVQGHQLSYWNYWLLMFFILAVQLAISLRWLAEPLSTLEPNSIASRMRCSYSTSNFFLAEAYCFVLLLLALFLNTLNRNIKRNYKEAKWLFGASFACTLVMIIWILFQAFASPVYVDYITILELYLIGTILLTFLFGPKIYVLLSYEPVIVECTYGQTTVPDKNSDLFEADWTPSSGTTSPTFSSRTASPLEHGGVVKSDSSTSSNTEAANPIFQTVLRKKNGVRRSQSENEQNLNGGLVVGRVMMPVSTLAVNNLGNPPSPPFSYRHA
uniref:G-protein coupled receptors family 3 profile domain-containing protein n=1 Tax=Ditylenchus dipsaci TaxID=166011 RepID=A0A915CY29_9BILA